MSPETTTKREPIFTRSGYADVLRTELRHLKGQRDALHLSMDGATTTHMLALYKEIQLLLSAIDTKQKIVDNLMAHQPSHGHELPGYSDANPTNGTHINKL